jgi:NAD(P)H-nitrite reductase large subunit
MKQLINEAKKMKQLINEAKRMQQLAGLIKEIQDLSSEDAQIEKVNTLVGDAINEYPNENDRDALIHAFERTTTPEADTFAIADRLAAGEIKDEDIKTIVDDVASKLGIMQKSITPGGRHAARIAAMGTKSDGGPTGIKGTEY